MLSLAIASGCADKAPRHSSVPNQHPKLAAALAIQGDRERQQALVRVAHDATADKDPETALAAIDAIGLTSVHDATAYDCALKFSDQRETPAATEVAKLIRDNSMRDAALQKIATGEKSR